MMSHWIITPVVLPAVLGALMVLAFRGQRFLQRVFALAGLSVMLGIALTLLWAAHNHPPEAYLLGNWPAPFGIVLMLDRLSALMVLVTVLLALPVALYAMASGWDTRGRHFHALFQFQLMGICGAFLTGDAFNLFVFFEVLLIASYGLMIHGGGAARLRAGVQYVAFNLVGSSLFLIALALIYAVTGTLNIADLAVKVQELPAGDMALMRVAAVLLMMVFAIKGALVPLQFWLPGTYANAPGPVAALFAIMTKIGAYGAIRFGMMVFPPQSAVISGLLTDLILPAALLTLVFGAVGMLAARDLARLAAFAAMASMGTVFIAVSQFDAQGVTAALYYMLHSTFAGAALFLLADMVQERRINGRVGAFYMLSAVAIAGMPPLSGFIGKLMIMQAVPSLLVWAVILGGSLVIVISLARMGSDVFWKQEATAKAPSALAYTALALLMGLLVAMSVFAGPMTQWLWLVAQDLADPAPYIAANNLWGRAL